MKFKSKSLISVILSIMMVISMIIVAIPANAAVIDSEPVGAGSYYIWYNKTKDSNIPSSYDGGPIPMSEEDGKQVGYFTSAAGRNVYFLINQSDKNATTNNIWTKEPKVNISSDFNWANGRYGGYGGSNYGLVETYVKNGVSANIKVVFDPVTNTVDLSVVSDTPSTPQPTTTTPQPTTTTPVSTTSWYLGGWVEDGKLEFADVNYKFTDAGNNTFTLTKTFSSNTQYVAVNDGSKTYLSDGSTSDDSNPWSDYKWTVDTSSSKTITFTWNATDKTLTWVTGGSTEPTEPTTTPVTTPGKFIIEDKTDANGKLTFSAPDKPAGTADAGNTVTITGTPLNSYYELSNVSVTYKVNKTEVPLVASETDGKFTFDIPSDLDSTTVKDATISVKGTFTLTPTGKLDYVKAQGAGLYIDVAPTKEDTTATLIKWNNYQGKDHGTSNPYTFYVPKNVNLANAVIYNTTGSQITLGGKTINNNEIAEGVKLTKGNNTITNCSITDKVVVMQGSTDAMFLNTTKEDGTDFDLPTARKWQGDNGITDKQASEYKATIKSSGGSCTTMDNTSGTAKFSSAMGLDTVKGRGNSSWKASATMFGKYAFNMKLKSKTNLLGMDSTESSGAKSWCLLANNADESMLRNALTYQLASEIGLLYSPEFRFVDIYDNGEYMGSYLVTEKVDVGSSKLVKGESFEDINEEAAGTVVEDAVTNEKYSYGGKTHEMSYAKVTADGNTSSIASKTGGKYLLEFEITERYKDETSWFTSPRGQHVVVKNPEFATKEQVTYIAQKFAAMEEIAFTTGATKAQLSTVMDVESFAKMYLIQEFSSNLDAASTSYYLTFDCSKNDAEGNGAVFVANPVWDYDWAYGQYNNEVGKKVDVDGNLLDTTGFNSWVAKNKAMDDSKKQDKGRSLQSQLAGTNVAFKSVIRKVWEETNGFYDKIQQYYSADGQITKWKDKISSSVNMNETRWGFIKDNLLTSWGTNDTGETFDGEKSTVTALNTWVTNRATWLNTQFTTTTEYKTYTPDVPTIMLCDANGNAISAVEQGKGFIIKVTSPLESNVTFRFFTSNGTQVGADQSDGILEIATNDLTVGETYTYKVQAVYNGKASDYSNTVSVTIADKAGNKQVTIYFKSASASVYVPSLSVDGSTPAVMTREKKTTETNGTYFGSTYSGSLKFYWFYTTMTIDASKAHTLVFTTKDNRVNAKKTYTFSPAEDNKYYFAVNNLMGDTNLVDLTDKAEYIRNYHISATHMVYAETEDNNVGFTWINGKEWAMGTYISENVNTANLTGLTASGLLTIPSALNPNAMLQASSTEFFTIKSATLAQRITAEAEEVSTLQYQLLDVNLDGVVDVKDSTMMQKALAGI